MVHHARVQDDNWQLTSSCFFFKVCPVCPCIRSSVAYMRANLPNQSMYFPASMRGCKSKSPPTSIPLVYMPLLRSYRMIWSTTLGAPRDSGTKPAWLCLWFLGFFMSVGPLPYSIGAPWSEERCSHYEAETDCHALCAHLAGLWCDCDSDWLGLILSDSRSYVFEMFKAPKSDQNVH